jgi:ATP citrate (pro-S)-lyase
MAKAIQKKEVTKTVVAYIAGTVSEVFSTPTQFGHAKALARNSDEKASSKRKALREAGAIVPDSFAEFVEVLSNLPQPQSMQKIEMGEKLEILRSRKRKLFVSTVTGEVDGEVLILGNPLAEIATKLSYANIITNMLLGREVKSEVTVEFMDLILKLLVDHGPYVSGAVNTMITARAGRDLVSALTSGLLTIGPRFGGAVNQAARNWFSGSQSGKKASEFVESFAVKREFILGIGHKKYSSSNPDPRLQPIFEFTSKLANHPYTDFAKAVEKVTVAKKANLILNMDGAIAATMLDILVQEESYSTEELQELIEIEFFNAIFVLARAVGFTAHYLDQRRIDEGLFRLGPDEVGYLG